MWRRVDALVHGQPYDNPPCSTHHAACGGDSRTSVNECSWARFGGSSWCLETCRHGRRPPPYGNLEARGSYSRSLSNQCVIRSPAHLLRAGHQLRTACPLRRRRSWRLNSTGKPRCRGGDLGGLDISGFGDHFRRGIGRCTWLVVRARERQLGDSERCAKRPVRAGPEGPTGGVASQRTPAVGDHRRSRGPAGGRSWQSACVARRSSAARRCHGALSERPAARRTGKAN
jgi:hypothetical protein